MRRANSIIVTLLVFICSSAALHAADLELTDAWISEAPPTVSVLAGYVRINNRSDEPSELLSISSPAFTSIEIHDSVVVDGLASMEKQGSLAIPANSTLELSPGGLHLMLFDPAAPLKAGDTARLEFTFANDTVMTVEAEVRKLESHGHHHHHH